jgi:protein-S-isoprenylcysteine O-methyltransferase Ste14
VTGGPYAIVRHPLYTFGTLFMYGMALTLASWFTLASATGGLLFLLARLPNEERHLVEAFGPAYTEYMKRTGGLLPRL